MREIGTPDVGGLAKRPELDAVPEVITAAESLIRDNQIAEQEAERRSGVSASAVALAENGGLRSKVDNVVVRGLHHPQMELCGTEPRNVGGDLWAAVCEFIDDKRNYSVGLFLSVEGLVAEFGDPDHDYDLTVAGKVANPNQVSHIEKLLAVLRTPGE